MTLEGENGFLRPNAAQYVGLALHELTTNALKYGALSRDDGMIVVRFETSPASPAVLSLLLAGDEQRGDARAERPQLRADHADARWCRPRSAATAELSFPPEGIRYELDIPKAQLVA